MRQTNRVDLKSAISLPSLLVFEETDLPYHEHAPYGMYCTRVQMGSSIQYKFNWFLQM